MITGFPSPIDPEAVLVDRDGQRTPSAASIARAVDGIETGVWSHGRLDHAKGNVLVGRHGDGIRLSVLDSTLRSEPIYRLHADAPAVVLGALDDERDRPRWRQRAAIWAARSVQGVLVSKRRDAAGVRDAWAAMQRVADAVAVISRPAVRIEIRAPGPHWGASAVAVSGQRRTEVLDDRARALLDAVLIPFMQLVAIRDTDNRTILSLGRPMLMTIGSDRPHDPMEVVRAVRTVDPWLAEACGRIGRALP